MGFILASNSPRRKQLMKEITNDFLVITREIDENSYLRDTPKDSVLSISKAKGELVAKQYPNDIIISADTIVVLNNKIIGKPKDKVDAFNILKSLSGNTHEVYTGYAIFYDNMCFQNVIISEVEFYPINDEFVNDYILTGSPMDKAGAYGVQDKESKNIIKKVKGSLNNVIGFPIEDLKEDLIKLKLINE